jgi:hypothetical protein
MPRCRDSRVAESNRSAPVAGAHVSGICIFIVLIYPRKVRGREVHGPAPAQHVGDQRQDGGALDHHRRRQVGRDLDCRRSALPAPPVDRGEEVLAPRIVRRVPSPVRGTDTGDKIEAALEKADIEFIEENGGGPGARIRKRIHKKPSNLRGRHKARAVALLAIETRPGLDGHRGPISPQDGQRTGKGCVPRERWVRSVPCGARCTQLSARTPGSPLGEALVWRYYPSEGMGGASDPSDAWSERTRRKRKPSSFCSAKLNGNGGAGLGDFAALNDCRSSPSQEEQQRIETGTTRNHSRANCGT